MNPFQKYVDAMRHAENQRIESDIMAKFKERGTIVGLTILYRQHGGYIGAFYEDELPAMGIHG